MTREFRVATIGATLAAALAGGFAWASIPDANNVIHTCYNQATGTFRPIDYPSVQCRNGEKQLDFNQKGPKGDPGTNGTNGINGINGIDGTNGINGIDGKDGQDGVSGYEIVSWTSVMFANTSGNFYAICPAGKRVLSAGWEVPPPSATAFSVNGGLPETWVGGPFDGQSVWRFRYVNDAVVNLTVNIKAVCAIAQ